MKKYLIIISITIIAGCNTTTIDSQKPAQDPQIDGLLQEWEGALIMPEGKSFVFGVMNDRENLYLSMSTQDMQTIIKVLRGFTVWIDHDGKNNKQYGIKYPIQPEITNTSGERDASRNQNDQLEFMIQQLLYQQDQMIIIDNNLPIFSQIDNGIDGILLKMNYDKGVLVYELKIPFDAVDLNTSKKFSIGLESIAMKKSVRNSGESGSRSGGGRSGGGRSGGGRSGGGMQSESKVVIDQINEWIKIQLYDET